MAISILYFARLRDVLGRAQESYPLPPTVKTIADLLGELRARGQEWASALAPEADFQIACNQVLCTPDQVVRAGDEVALFPPVTGG